MLNQYQGVAKLVLGFILWINENILFQASRLPLWQWHLLGKVSIPRAAMVSADVANISEVLHKALMKPSSKS